MAKSRKLPRNVGKFTLFSRNKYYFIEKSPKFGQKLCSNKPLVSEFVQFMNWLFHLVHWSHILGSYFEINCTNLP